MVPAGGDPIYYVEEMLGTSCIISQNNGTACYDADFTQRRLRHPLLL
jgi:hypothetical protein